MSVIAILYRLYKPVEKKMDIDFIAVVLLYTSLSSIIWLPIILICFPRKIAIFTFLGTLILGVAAHLFSLISCGDGNPWQWPSVFIFMASIVFIISSLITIGIVTLRDRLFKKRKFKATEPGH